MSETWIDAPPPPPDSPAAIARVHLRYEDVCQDGRLLLEVMPNALGAAVWNAQLARDELAKSCFAQGIVPILTRFVIEGSPGPFGVAPPLAATGRFQIAQVTDDRGEPSRVALNMWAELAGPRGRTYPPPPEGAGETIFAGRIFGEHVFTRLFAAPGERRIRTLDLPGVPKNLPRHVQRSFSSMTDGDFVRDDAAITFGLVHTDSNHHVNSLVYLRLFEEASLRAFASRGNASPVLARRMEIAYRKPCFAGDRMRVHVRVGEHEGKLAASAVIAPEDAPPSSAHAAARIVFE
jgi:hypothetical protein